MNHGYVYFASVNHVRQMPISTTLLCMSNCQCVLVKSVCKIIPPMRKQPLQKEFCCEKWFPKWQKVLEKHVNIWDKSSMLYEHL